MNTAIPEEIIFFEILKRLPVKSLCRFQAVSKSWLSIITSRLFIDSHFEISKLNPTRLFAFYNEDIATATPTFFSTNHPQTSYKLWDRDYFYSSISPRGLICFHNVLCDDATVQIWNPSTGERIEVNPKPPNTMQVYYFLGFDPVTKNHKLLSPSVFGYEYYLLTLGEKNWRKIITTDDDDDGSSRNLTFSDEHCSIDGTLYYLVWSRDQKECTNLMAFDFGSERFLETIRLPENSVKFNNDGVCIRVYRGKIVFLNYNWPRCTDGFEMWVLEDAKKQKWSPKRIIPPLPPLPSSLIHYKLGVIDGEELLIFSTLVDANSERFRVCRYDLEKDRWLENLFPDFRVEELDGSAKFWVSLYSYVDSLESLARVKGI